MNKNKKIISLLALLAFTVSLTAPLAAMESKNEKEAWEEKKMDDKEKEKQEAKERGLRAAEKLRQMREKQKEQTDDFFKKNGSQTEKELTPKEQLQDEDKCPICQESLKNNSCITLHKSTVGDIPHTFHAWCLYCWLKPTHLKELGDPEKGSKSEKTISTPCLFCHEWDKTKDPLPKDDKNDPNEKLRYPPKKFDISVAELCKGYTEYLQKLTLKEKFENLENLPPQIIVDTLIALAGMNAEEREEIYKDEKENDLKIELIMFRKILREPLTPPLCIIGLDWKIGKSELPDEILVKAVNAALSLLGNRPLAKEFAWAISDLLDREQSVACFKRAFDCQDTLTPPDKLLAHASSMNAYIFDNNKIEDIENAEFILDYCLTADLLAQFAQSLTSATCSKYFNKFLEKKGPRPEAKKTLLAKVFKTLSYKTQLDFFDVVYPQLHDTHKTARLVELKKELVKKKGIDEVCKLVAACVKDENVTPLDKSRLIEAYEKEYFGLLPISEKIEFLEILPSLTFVNTVKEMAALSTEEKSSLSIDNDKLARNLQRAVCNNYKNDCLFCIDQEVLSKILKMLDNQKIYKEFVTVIFSHLASEKQILFFEKAAKNNDHLFSDEIFDDSDSEASDSEDEPIIAEKQHKLHCYVKLCAFYKECLPALPIELQILHLKKFLNIEAPNKKLRGKTVRHIIKADKSNDVLLGCYDAIYPLLKDNQKMDLLISGSDKLTKQRGQEVIAVILNDICKKSETYEIAKQQGSCNLEKLWALLKKYWGVLSHKQHLRLFSRICCGVNGEEDLFVVNVIAEIFEQLGKESTSENTWHAYFLKLFKICGWPKVSKSRELLEFYWDKIPNAVRDTALKAFLTSCKIFEDHEEICACLQKFGAHISKDVIDAWVLTSETKKLCGKYALPRIYWKYLSERGRLRAAKPLIFETNNLYNEQKEVTLETFEKESYPQTFMQQLASTRDSIEQLKILGSLWPQIEQKYRAKGLMVALVFIDTSRDKIFEIIKPAEWLPQSDYKEKKKILRFLWREDAKNRLYNYQMVFKSCNEQDKKQLKKRYDKKVVSTVNTLSIAAQIITSHLPSFIAPKIKPSKKSDNILRDPDNQI